jgi:cyclic pyranopterin phosphate synthase
MPKGIDYFPKEEILNYEEIVRLVKIFVDLGIKKIRITGGEPLVREDVVKLINFLVSIKGVKEITLTTNGTLLSRYIQKLREVGIKRINISLDTLKPEKFKMITGEDLLVQVLQGIKRVKELGFFPMKINMVVMKGINDDEILDFIRFSLSNNLILRFIEFMEVSPLWNNDYFIPIEFIKQICKKNFGLKRIEEGYRGPAEYYRVEGGTVGFIKTDLKNCLRCNRLRLTSTGELKLCLYQNKGIFLKEILRNGFDDDFIKNLIKDAIKNKRRIDYRSWQSCQNYMYAIGG